MFGLKFQMGGNVAQLIGVFFIKIERLTLAVKRTSDKHAIYSDFVFHGVLLTAKRGGYYTAPL